jgi:hypothetical protein
VADDVADAIGRSLDGLTSPLETATGVPSARGAGRPRPAGRRHAVRQALLVGELLSPPAGLRRGGR